MTVSTQAEGAWTYKDACNVLSRLRSVGVECGVAVGGVWLTFDLERHGVAVVQIIKEGKGVFCHQTMMQGLTLESARQAYRKNVVEKLEKLWNSN